MQLLTKHRMSESKPPLSPIQLIELTAPEAQNTIALFLFPCFWLQKPQGSVDADTSGSQLEPLGASRMPGHLSVQPQLQVIYEQV